MLAKCPNCRSRFEINESQLRVADGLVRCGACLHVFDGRDAALNPEEAQKLSGIDQELEAIEAQIQAIEENRTNPIPRKSLDEELADFSANLKADDGNTDIEPNLLNNEVESFDIVHGKPEQFSTFEYQEPELPESGDNLASETIEIHESPKPKAVKKPSKLEEDINNFFATTDKINHQGSSANSYAGHQPLAKESHNPPDLTSLTIDDEPLSLKVDASEKTKISLAKICIGLAAVCLLGFCVYIFNNFNNLSLKPETRPRMALLCRLVQCELPLTYSESFLKVTSRSTRQVKDKLEVDAVIFNTNNNFDMPFPDIVMRFTDLNDELLAQYSVPPEEYRQGELARMEKFPSNTSAHIKFTLPSPGDNSVSFTIDFHYPKPLK